MPQTLFHDIPFPEKTLSYDVHVFLDQEVAVAHALAGLRIEGKGERGGEDVAVLFG